jgi:hypothetical protein
MSRLEEKGSSTPSSEVINHNEFADFSDRILHADISYDREGIGGILRSPFVFGAALLASFGGFSFGYGKVVDDDSQAFADENKQTKASSP